MADERRRNLEICVGDDGQLTCHECGEVIHPGRTFYPDDLHHECPAVRCTCAVCSWNEGYAKGRAEANPD